MSNGYSRNYFSPYRTVLDLADISKDTMLTKAKTVGASGARIKKESQLRGELTHKQEEAYKKAEEARKKAERKANKRSGLFKGLKLLGSLLGPVAGAALTGITTGVQANQQRQALKGLSRNLGNINLGGSWGGRTRGLSWLSDPTKQFEKGMQEGSKEAWGAAKSINPFESAAMAGLGSFAMSKAMGSEGIFGGGKASDIVATPSTPMAGSVAEGFSPLGLGEVAETTFAGGEKLGFGQRLAKQFGIGDLSTKEGKAKLLEILPLFSSIFSGGEFEIPEFNQPTYR